MSGRFVIHPDTGKLILTPSGKLAVGQACCCGCYPQITWTTSHDGMITQEDPWAVSGDCGHRLSFRFEHDDNCSPQELRNANTQEGAATGTFTLDRWMVVRVSWFGMGELQDQDFEKMQMTINGRFIGNAHAAGGKQGCRLGPVVSSPEAATHKMLLPPGTHTIEIEVTSNDPYYHFDAQTHTLAYYGFSLVFEEADGDAKDAIEWLEKIAPGYLGSVRARGSFVGGKNGWPSCYTEFNEQAGTFAMIQMYAGWPLNSQTAYDLYRPLVFTHGSVDGSVAIANYAVSEYWEGICKYVYHTWNDENGTPTGNPYLCEFPGVQTPQNIAVMGMKLTGTVQVQYDTDDDNVTVIANLDGQFDTGYEPTPQLVHWNVDTFFGDGETPTNWAPAIFAPQQGGIGGRSGLASGPAPLVGQTFYQSPVIQHTAQQQVVVGNDFIGYDDETITTTWEIA
ncbi:hypothetical protein [Mucisphaera calidilacus]|uniref:Uncharacterized protein n=1 Tax=Mucisphaera calidilacus TaxID=2527982 RepID=A0A518BVP4_9BACT|nr:hypothetical protein [Mucisphaera calidilacus]QDU71031.1 hypothetical protein Pan265_08760 [Mucisphaera calidilacus]